jgi:hypothetical protein
LLRMTTPIAQSVTTAATVTDGTRGLRDIDKVSSLFCHRRRQAQADNDVVRPLYL